MIFSDQKQFIFIISTGRTGTKFMGHVMSQLIEDAYSVHEPDSIDFDKSLKHNLQTIQMLGLKGTTIGKLRGQTGIYNISRLYLSGEISEEEAMKAVYVHRRAYYQKIEEKTIIESHYGWYGLIPIIRKMFPKHKLILMYRNPKTWIKSNIDFGTLYGKRDYLDRFFNLRIKPSMVNDDAAKVWSSYDQFQKLCWYWSFVNKLLHTQFKSNSDLEIKYEELFRASDKEKHWLSMLEFATQFDSTQSNYQFKKEILDRPLNKSVSTVFPNYQEWSEDQKSFLQKCCGSGMSELSYSSS